jgi:isoquinoline 1-oxidoreductase alpha subunit
LRDQLKLTGAKYGCGVGGCGCCSVLVDGDSTRSCLMEISEIGDSKVVTIEGLSANGDHPVQKAWLENDVPQCGYCQAGQIISATALLDANPKPSDDEIREAMAGNLCRCGAYGRIHKAIKSAAEATK